MAFVIRFVVYVLCYGVWVGGIALVGTALVAQSRMHWAVIYHWEPKRNLPKAERHLLRRVVGGVPDVKEIVELYLLGPTNASLRRSQRAWVRVLSATSFNRLLVLNLSKELYSLSSEEERRFLRHLALSLRANNKTIDEVAFFVEGKRLSQIHNDGRTYKERNSLRAFLGEPMRSFEGQGGVGGFGR